MDLLFKVKKFITDHELIVPGDHVIVAVSGGVDSMVLSHLLTRIRDEIGFLISVVHVNHGLRGKDADDDQKFVDQFCRTNEIPFFAIKWNGPQKGENVQEAARNFRYKVFAETVKKVGGDKIVLAHNLDDQAETVLLNLIRGAGLDGICGMSVKKEYSDGIYVIRPLIDISREEIDTFAQEQGVSYRKDISNDQVKYTRNFIRHKIMPLIREINPQASESIAKMTDLLKTDEAYIQAATTAVFSRIILEKNETGLILDETGFSDLEPSIRRRVLKLAYVEMTGSVAGITRDHILKMEEIALADRKEGSYNLPNSLLFQRKGGKLAIFKN